MKCSASASGSLSDNFASLDLVTTHTVAPGGSLGLAAWLAGDSAEGSWMR